MIWRFNGVKELPFRYALVVLGAGLEPACLSAYAPQTYVSAIPPPERFWKIKDGRWEIESRKRFCRPSPEVPNPGFWISRFHMSRIRGNQHRNRANSSHAVKIFSGSPCNALMGCRLWVMETRR